MLMKGFQHRNVMTMSGLVLRDNRPFVILPFMKNGDLRTFVSDHKKVCILHTFKINITALPRNDSVHMFN